VSAKRRVSRDTGTRHGVLLSYVRRLFAAANSTSSSQLVTRCQRSYFLPGPQALFSFVHTSAFRERAAELSGYDVSAAGEVRLVN